MAPREGIHLQLSPTIRPHWPVVVLEATADPSPVPSTCACKAECGFGNTASTEPGTRTLAQILTERIEEATAQLADQLDHLPEEVDGRWPSSDLLPALQDECFGTAQKLPPISEEAFPQQFPQQFPEQFYIGDDHSSQACNSAPSCVGVSVEELPGVESAVALGGSSSGDADAAAWAVLETGARYEANHLAQLPANLVESNAICAAAASQEETRAVSMSCWPVHALVHRMDVMEQELVAKIERHVASVHKREEDHRIELAMQLTEALARERNSRTLEIALLRTTLDAISDVVGDGGLASFAATVASRFADLARREVENFATAAKKEWEDTSRRLSELQAHLAEELSEQHARAALDLAERQLDAMRAADLGDSSSVDNAAPTSHYDLGKCGPPHQHSTMADRCSRTSSMVDQHSSSSSQLLHHIDQLEKKLKSSIDSTSATATMQPVRRLVDKVKRHGSATSSSPVQSSVLPCSLASPICGEVDGATGDIVRHRGSALIVPAERVALE